MSQTHICPSLKKFTHSFVLVLWLCLFYTEISKVKHDMKVCMHFIFSLKMTSSCPSTIHWKFRLFPSCVKYHLNHRTYVLCVCLFLYLILLHFPIYSCARTNYVHCKGNLDISTSNRASCLPFFSPCFLEFSWCFSLLYSIAAKSS